MALLGKKLAFHVLATDYPIKPQDEIMDRIREQKYKPLEGDRTECDCWVSTEAEIEDEFKTKYVDNKGDAQSVVLQFLHAEKKPNAKIVQRRYKAELKKMRAVQLATSIGWKETPEIRKELKDRVRHEEAVKSTPTFNLTQVCAMINKMRVLAGTRSEKSWHRMSNDFFAACAQADDGVSNDYCPEMLKIASNKNDMAKMQPFTINQFASAPPQSAQRFVSEFLTWLVLRSLDDKQSKIQALGWVKLKYIGGEKNQSTLKASDESSSTAVFAAQALLEGALVDEAKLSLEGDWFKTGDKATIFRLDSTGYLSDLDHKMPGQMQRDLPATVLECAMGLWEALMEEAKRFYDLRMDAQKWSKEAARIRDLAKKACK